MIFLLLLFLVGLASKGSKSSIAPLPSYSGLPQYGQSYGATSLGSNTPFGNTPSPYGPHTTPTNYNRLNNPPPPIPSGLTALGRLGWESIYGRVHMLTGRGGDTYAPIGGKSGGPLGFTLHYLR